MVYESTAECFVTGNALAGAIPTEIGQLAQLNTLYVNQNQLAGACTENSLDCNGKGGYHELKKDVVAAQATSRQSWAAARA